MTRSRYAVIREWFLECPVCLKILRFLYFFLPLSLYISYPFLALILAAQKDWHTLLPVLFFPAAVFLGVTFLRRRYNAPRPYEVWGLPPILPRNKKGHSFPSRHCAAASVIAMAFWYVSPAAGKTVLLCALLIAVCRVLAGVHFVRDVLAGLAIGTIGGLLGFLFL